MDIASKSNGITLNNGEKIPLIGIGTWEAKSNDVYEGIKIAIDAGYRFIDTAHIYDNEKYIGRAIQDKIADQTIVRKDLVVSSKLWCLSHDPKAMRIEFNQTLKNLQLEYLDLYLIHWPMAFEQNSNTSQDLTITQEYIELDIDFVHTWNAMEQLVQDGLVKSIGISNFNLKQTKRLMKSAKIQPAVLQIECHPYLIQKELSIFCKDNHIQVVAYSPLGSPTRPNIFTGEPNLFSNRVIQLLARLHNRSMAQIMIRYQIQRGHIPIPKSINNDRIRSNLNVFDFELSSDDMAALNELNYNRRFVSMLTFCDFKEYPFNDDRPLKKNMGLEGQRHNLHYP